MRLKRLEPDPSKIIYQVKCKIKGCWILLPSCGRQPPPGPAQRGRNPVFSETIATSVNEGMPSSGANLRVHGFLHPGPYL